MWVGSGDGVKQEGLRQNLSSTGWAKIVLGALLLHMMTQKDDPHLKLRIVICIL